MVLAFARTSRPYKKKHNDIIDKKTADAFFLLDITFWKRAKLRNKANAIPTSFQITPDIPAIQGRRGTDSHSHCAPLLPLPELSMKQAVNSIAK
jgi:hypothetical protein